MKDTMNKAAPDERYALLDRLLEDDYALVHLNTSSEGLQIPAHLRVQPTVTLKLSRYFRRGIRLTDERVETELLFNGVYEQCYLPWSSIWGITSFAGELKIWGSAVPESLADEVAKLQRPDEALPEGPVKLTRNGKAVLRRVK